MLGADNQIIIEALAKIDEARKDLESLAASATKDLKGIPRKEIELDSRDARRNLNQLEKALETLRASGAKVTKINLPVDEAVANVERLSEKVKGLGAGDPLGPVSVALARASAAVADFADRTDQDSKKFGQGLEAAATRSKVALEALTAEVQRAIAAGAPVRQEDLAKLDRLETEYRQAAKAAHEFRAAQVGVRSEIGNTAPVVGLLQNSLDRTAAAFKAFIVAEVLSFLRDLGSESIEASEKLRRIRVALESVSGSSEKAQSDLAFVRAETERLGLKLDVAADGFSKLTAGAKGTELEGERIRDVFAGIAEKATVAGLTSEQFERVIKALSDSLSKGTLTAEELRQQLGDNLPDAANTMARALGISKEELFDLMKKGLIPATTAVEALARQYREDLGDAVEQSTDSATANLNRLSTAVFEAKAQFGEGLKPVVGESSVELARFVKTLGPVIQALGRLTPAIIEATNPLITLLRAIARVLPESEKAAAGTEQVARTMPRLASAAETTAKKIAAAVVEIVKYAEQLPQTGKVQQEEADKIVKAIDKQLKAIRELPPAEESAFRERAAILEQLRARFEEFTTAHEKELAKQERALEKNLKKQQAALEEFTTKLRDAFKIEKDDKGAQTAADLKREIAEAEAELLRLETKGPGNIEESNRITELKNQISDLKIDLDRLGEAYEDLGPKVSEGAEQAKEAILGLLTSSEEFGETFRKLPFEFQQAIQQLVEGFVSDLESGLATGEEDVQRFVSQFSTLLEQGGAVTDEFAQKLRALAGADTPVADLFAALKKGADESKASLEEAGRVAGSTAESYIKIARAAEDSGKAASAATTSTVKLKEEMIEIRGPLSAAQENTMKWKDEVLKIGPATEKAAPAVKLIASHTSTAAKNQREWADGLKSTTEEVKKLNPLLEKMLDMLKGIAETLPKANPAHAGEVLGE